jgi:hypothetical protein
MIPIDQGEGGYPNQTSIAGPGRHFSFKRDEDLFRGRNPPEGLPNPTRHHIECWYRIW